MEWDIGDSPQTRVIIYLAHKLSALRSRIATRFLGGLRFLLRLPRLAPLGVSPIQFCFGNGDDQLEGIAEARELGFFAHVLPLPRNGAGVNPRAGQTRGGLFLVWPWVRNEAAFVCAPPDCLAMVIGFCEGRFHAVQKAIAANKHVRLFVLVESSVGKEIIFFLKSFHFVSLLPREKERD